MDLVTQGILGAAVSQAAYGHKGGKKVAVAGFVLGLLPDLDVLARVFGQWASLRIHRGPTHSLLICFVMAFPLGLLCKRLAKNDMKSREWIIVAMLALVTHPILDWFTSYGTALLWPFTEKRYSVDSLAIIDFVYSTPLLIVTLLGIFTKVKPKKVQMLSIAALGFCMAYTAWGYKNSQVIAKAAEALFHKTNGFVALETRAMPTLLNISVFRTVSKDADGHFMVSYFKSDSDKALSEVRHVTTDDDEFVERAMEHEHVKLFKLFCMDMMRARSYVNEAGRREVMLTDMRYGSIYTEADGLFSVRVSFDEAGAVSAVEQVRPDKFEIKKEMSETFKYIL